MPIITEIKSKILQLDGGSFQVLCDEFLYRKGEYKNILCLGSNSGTLKTTVGNPDTYVRTAEGKYIFFIYTTQKGSIYSKIKDDIEKCFDTEKTGVKIADIKKIICCHTSSNLTAGKDKELHKLCKGKNIILELYSLDTLASEIYSNYPILAFDFLKVPIDTNQILTYDIFEKQYNSNKMLAPLSTIFQFREKEKMEIIESLKNNEVTIVTGNAGVGKTKLVLEVVKEYSQQNNYKLFCIKNKDLSIINDLYRYFNNPDNYLMFIDDGNELKGIKYILELLTKEKLNIKIIVTVREYAKDIIIKKVQQFSKPNVITIESFTKEEIKKFLEVNLKIINFHYVEKIQEIAKGNPRIAYMIGKIALREERIDSLHNVTEVYKTYYENSEIMTDRELGITAGLISLFQGIDLEKVQEKLEIVNISLESFLKNAEILSEMEFVEIKFDKIVRITDQCFSDYVLYLFFIEKRYIELSNFIEISFHKFRKELLQAIRILLEIFGSSKVRNYVKEEVNVVWEKYEKNNTLSDDFIKVFFSFNETKALIYTQNKIKKEKIIENMNLIKFEEKNIVVKEEILLLLQHYRYSENLSLAIDLILEYLKKRQDKILEVFTLLIQNYNVDKEAYIKNYYTQKIVIKEIIKFLKEPIIKRLFLKIAQEFLKTNFESIEPNARFANFYRIPLELKDGSEEYRKDIWETLLNLTKKNEDTNLIIEILKFLHYKENNKVLEFDKCYIFALLRELRKTEDEFILAKIYFNLKENNKIIDEKLEELLELKKWKIYDSLQYRHVLKDYEQKEKEFKDKIYDFNKSIKKEEVNTVLNIIMEIQKEEDIEINQGLGMLLKFIAEDKEKLLEFLKCYSNGRIELYLYPDNIIEKMIQFLGAKSTYDIIWQNEFFEKSIWQYVFFVVLPKEEITKEYTGKLLTFFKLDTDNILCNRNLEILDKFLKFNPNIYVVASEIIFEKRRYCEKIVECYFKSLFNSHKNNPEKLLNVYRKNLSLLKEIYFFLLNKNIDYYGIFFKRFFEEDRDYLQRALKEIEKKGVKNVINSCWEYENYLEIFDYIFYEVLKNDEILSWKYQDIFIEFPNDNNNHKKVFWVKHLIEENFNNENIFYIFNIVSEFKYSDKLEFILKFLELNSDYEVFQRLDLHSIKAWIESRIPLLREEMEFYNDLLFYLKKFSNLQYLEHIAYVEKKINEIKMSIRREEEKELINEIEVY